MEIVHYRLYLHAESEQSPYLVDAVRNVCASIHGELHRFETVYTTQHTGLTGSAGIWATPLLERVAPAPRQRLFGDLADTQRLRQLLQAAPMASELGD